MINHAEYKTTIVVLSTKPQFVTHEASENTTFLYKKSTGNITSAEVTVNADSLQAFKVGENKVKLLFKVE